MIIDTTFARELAADLLEINAVILRPNEPFTWASGWHSPIYCDNRLTLRQPHIRSKIASKFSEFITQEFPGIDVVTGTATAGIPHAAWVADKVNKPMAYVRAKPKSYGMGNQIEGGVAKGEKTVVIEDLVSTGGSAISVINPSPMTKLTGSRSKLLSTTWPFSNVIEKLRLTLVLAEILNSLLIHFYSIHPRHCPTARARRPNRWRSQQY